MAGVKALRSIAENLIGVTRVVDSATDVSRVAPNAGTLKGFDDLAEYQRVANDLDNATPTQIRQEIAFRETETAEIARKDGITNPAAELRLDFQTQSSEEFSERLTKQLRSPEFATESVLLGPNPEFQQSVIKSQEVHKATVDQALTGLRKNKRWVARTDEWVGDSPYKDDLLFHTDRQSDPLRADSFIQFEDPREIGIHAGTNRAAEGIVKRGGIDEAMRNAEMQAEALKQVAGTLDRPVAEIERIFAQTVNNHFLNKFRGSNEFVPNVWDEVEGIIDEFIDQFGGSRNQISQFMQGMKDLPTPNTTPLLFRGKNGLLLSDEGGFSPIQVSRQLDQIFPDDVDTISTALGTGDRAAKTKALTEFIESKGYDHIVYHNSVEDKGSLSIINWNPELQRTLWHPDFTRDNPVEQAKQASSYILGVLGVGSAAVREE